MPQLVTARRLLEAKDLPGAMAQYEQVLATAGDRADVLVTISGDLGVNGHVREIVELVAPRYDAERHGPATGLNLLQAYLALRQADAAQHVLDILFSLQRPELEDRLHGFSNAIAELIQADVAPIDTAAESGQAAAEPEKANFVSISKPMWFYGLEPLAAQVLPPKEGRLRRVAFTQLTLAGVPKLEDVTRQPETEAGRLTRAIPLWLAETFYFSPHYQSIAVVAVLNQKHYALLGTELTTDNMRQLVDTTEGGLDYIFTGVLRAGGGGFELTLRVWEVKKYRERKTLTTRWTPETADVELAKLHEQIRAFMEWTPEKQGVPYAAPQSATVWLGQLGTSLSLFFGEKNLLPADQIIPAVEVVQAAAAQAGASEGASLAWLTLTGAARRLGVAENWPEPALASSPLVEQARALTT